MSSLSSEEQKWAWLETHPGVTNIKAVISSNLLVEVKAISIAVLRENAGE